MLSDEEGPILDLAGEIHQRVRYALRAQAYTEGKTQATFEDDSRTVERVELNIE